LLVLLPGFLLWLLLGLGLLSGLSLGLRLRLELSCRLLGLALSRLGLSLGRLQGLLISHLRLHLRLGFLPRLRLPLLRQGLLLALGLSLGHLVGLSLGLPLRLGVLSEDPEHLFCEGGCGSRSQHSPVMKAPHLGGHLGGAKSSAALF
jgi:hypothetical protein